MMLSVPMKRGDASVIPSGTRSLVTSFVAYGVDQEMS